MSLSKTQKGAVGEMYFSVLAALGSDGELELFRPEYDDDQVDLVAGRRGEAPRLALQVKTALALDAHGRVRAYVAGRQGHLRQDASFLYVIVWIAAFEARGIWVVPSADFNRLARLSSMGRLEFVAAPEGGDAAAAFRLTAPEVGAAVLARIDALRSAPPADLAGVPRTLLPAWPGLRRV